MALLAPFIGAEFLPNRLSYFAIPALLKRYPQSHYLQTLGAYACLARDRDTTLRVIETLHKSGAKPGWERPYSADSCINWAERS